MTAKNKHGKGSIRSNEVLIVAPNGDVVARIVADVTNPLKCGARAYVETRYAVVDAKDQNTRLD